MPTIPANVLQRCCASGNDRSFNCITVDGDTSTSDTLLLVRHGQGRPSSRCARRRTSALKDFRAKLERAAGSISRCQVVRDGEGAQKFVTIEVTGAASDQAAPSHRPRRRQFAAGEDGDRRRGRELGPHRHGRRQGRREGRPRPAADRHRRRHRSPRRASAAPATTRRRSRAYEGPARSTSPSMSASARARPRSGPAI